MPSRGQLTRTNQQTTSEKPANQVTEQFAAETKRGKCQPVRLYVKGCFYSFHRCVPA